LLFPHKWDRKAVNRLNTTLSSSVCVCMAFGIYKTEMRLEYSWLAACLLICTGHNKKIVLQILFLYHRMLIQFNSMGSIPHRNCKCIHFDFFLKLMAFAVSSKNFKTNYLFCDFFVKKSEIRASMYFHMKKNTYPLMVVLVSI